MQYRLFVASVRGQSTDITSVSRSGHFNLIPIVANIAKNYLYENDRTVHDDVETMLLYLWDYDPDVIRYEDTHHFVEAATFADDIRYTSGGSWNAPYHFVDFPYISEGQESDYNINPDPKNLTLAIPTLMSWLSGKNGTDYLQSDIYTRISALYPG